MEQTTPRPSFRVARVLARALADALEVLEADYEAFEQEAIDELLAGLDEELLSGLGGVYAYTLEGDRLSVTTEREDETRSYEFQRIGSVTSVAQTSWGQIKRMQP